MTARSRYLPLSSQLPRLDILDILHDSAPRSKVVLPFPPSGYQASGLSTSLAISNTPEGGVLYFALVNRGFKGTLEGLAGSVPVHGISSQLLEGKQLPPNESFVLSVPCLLSRG